MQISGSKRSYKRSYAIGPCDCGAEDCPRCYPQPRREVDDEPRDSGRTWEVEAVEWGGAEKKGEL